MILLGLQDKKLEFQEGFNKKYKMKKSTVEEIKSRFDNDVERFSNLNTGQVSTIDAQISLEHCF